MSRYDYIDIAKGLGILLVIFGHVQPAGSLTAAIYAFHMPLFFLISGMLFHPDRYSSFGSFAITRLKKLYLPFILYAVATFLLWWLWCILSNGYPPQFLNSIYLTLKASNFKTLEFNSALWFIPCLIVVEFLFYSLHKLPSALLGLLCLALAAGSYLAGEALGPTWWRDIPLKITTALVALPFYAAGFLCVKHASHERFSDFFAMRPLWSASLVAALAFAVAAGSVGFLKCSIGSGIFPIPFWIFMLRAFAGILMILVLSALLARYQSAYRWLRRPVAGLRWCGINSLHIMCSHYPLKNIFVFLAVMMFATEPNLPGWPALLTAFLLTTGCTVAYVAVFRLIRSRGRLPRVFRLPYSR